MKTIKRVTFLLLVLFMVQVTSLPSFVAPVTVEAATKSGLVKEKGQYYFYSKGKKVVKTWKKINGKKYYFGRKGAAFKAKNSAAEKFQVAHKKVGSRYYGFNKKGVLVKAGVYTNLKGYIYIYKANGTYDLAKTRALRNAIKNNDVEKAFSILGPYKSFAESSSCQAPNSTDIVYTYPYVYVTVIKSNETGALTFPKDFAIYTR